MQEEFKCLFIDLTIFDFDARSCEFLGLELSRSGTSSDVLMSEPDVVSHQHLGLLEGDVHRLPGRAVLAVSAAGAQGAGQDRHLDNGQASLHLLS